MNWLNRLQSKENLHAIGLMSGTSADGLDLAHVEITPGSERSNFSLKYFDTWPYPGDIQQQILDIAAPNGGNIEDVCQLNSFLGHYYANIILEYLDRNGLSSDQVDFIGSHGQTVCHLPEKRMVHGIQFGSTLQVGDPSVLANRTGILTVGDFRMADTALGGEGAPLVPIFDFLYFRDPAKNRLVLNIGGIANITSLPANCSFSQVLAFDTGPGNVLIDSLANHYWKIPFDHQGKMAYKGKFHQELLSYLERDEYFERKPPKSTGREKFAGPVLQDILSFANKRKIKPEDILATVTEFTARTIYQASKNFIAHHVDELIISGGGAENPFLMERIAFHFRDSTIFKSNELGLMSDAKEATCFAILAYQTFFGYPSNLPSVTGAAHQTILGKICIPRQL